MNHRATILVVDDEPRMCESLRSLLEQQGYLVQTAETGREAKAKLHREEFDLVLTDLIMPDIHGEELLDYIKSLYPDTMVIMITGNASLESAVSTLRKGAYDYLRKPFEFEELLKTVHNALNHRRLKQEKEIISGQLELSQDRYRYLVQNSPDIIYTLDTGGYFTFVSSAVERLLGYSRDVLLGNHYSDIVYEEDRQKAQWVFNERRTGQRATSGIELRLKCAPRHDTCHCREEGYLTVELKATGMYDKPVSAKTKRFLGTHGVARDVSDRKRLEAQLMQAQKMEALGTLAAGIAHDFNNLLTGIQGLTSLMLLKSGPPSPDYDRLRSIEQHVHSGAELTAQLLGFAKGGKPRARTLNINKLLRQSSSMFNRTRRETTIHQILDDDLWKVRGDRGQIEQVLLNLFLNASQAMPENGDIYLESENVNLQETAARLLNLDPGRYVRISITDKGVGMDHETVQRIFEPFFTTKKSGRGTGLGLAMAYGIIRNHGGAIDVKSKPDVGSTFSIYLPAVDPVVKTDPTCRPSATIYRGEETVLLVDDEDVILETAGEILKTLGYRVFVAKDGCQSIDLYVSKMHEIDVVVLDMVMPGKGGHQVIRELQRINPDVKVLLATGYGLDGETTAVLERGCQGFIQKPFTVETLSRKLREVLDNTIH